MLSNLLKNTGSKSKVDKIYSKRLSMTVLISILLTTHHSLNTLNLKIKSNFLMKNKKRQLTVIT